MADELYANGFTAAQLRSGRARALHPASLQPPSRTHRLLKSSPSPPSPLLQGSNTDKLTANVSFPLKELCLADFASPECPVPPPDCTYDLFAVSNHYGTLGGGHYTAICRAPMAGGKETWYSYNDEVVTQVPATQVRREGRECERAIVWGGEGGISKGARRPGTRTMARW